MTAKLIAEEGPLKGLVLSLEEGEEWTLGRDPDMCQLVVEDPTTSRRHLVCRQTDKGIIVENLSSTNPIEINDEPMIEPQLLRHGDTMKIGSGVYRFYTSEGASIASLPEKEEVVANESAGIAAVEVEEKEEELPPEEEPLVDEIEEEEKIEEEPIRHDTIFDEEEEEEILEEESYEPAGEEISFNLDMPGRWLLKVIAGPNNGAEFVMLPSHSYVVGTDAAVCDIVFHDISVSRKHARLTVSDDENLTIEDMESRNGSLVDGDTIEEKTLLVSNNLVTLGTTTFVVIDKEAERETIVSPPLASFGRVVQDEATVEATQKAVGQLPEDRPVAPAISGETTEEKASHAVSGLLLLSIITGLFVIIGFGVSTLFRTNDVIQEEVDVSGSLSMALESFPSIQYSYTKSNGTLLLLGHLASGTDRSQLLYNLQGLPFIKNIDNNIIIDEFVWQEANQVLAKNPKWRSVSIHSPEPGRFLMTGYLKTKAEEKKLFDYMSLNFAYPELLEKNVIVEEQVSDEAARVFREKNLLDVEVTMNAGEMTLRGEIGRDKEELFKELLLELKALTGVRSLVNYVAIVAPQSTIIDLSGEYEVSGYSNIGGVALNVVIEGRILTKGDVLDGMTITNITPGTIYLEKEGFKYKIDFNK